MRNSLIAKFISFLLISPLSINPALSQNIDKHLLGNQLEKVLNEKKSSLLKELFLKKSFNQFNKQYTDFNKKYKDSKWLIRTIRNQGNKAFLDIEIKSNREVGDQIYNLRSKLIVEIETFNNKIKSYNIINSESILNSKDSPLVIKVVSPDDVLTGERYEINLIIERPLDKSLIAGGMIVVENKKGINISNNMFSIKPNQSGGLFKYIQAPLEPGFQTVSAIIAHPEGIYSITKTIKVGLSKTTFNN